MAVGSAVHSELKGARFTGMEGCFIPTIHHQTSRPAPTMQWMQRRVFNITCIKFQEGQPCLFLSQQATWWGYRPVNKGPHYHTHAKQPYHTPISSCTKLEGLNVQVSPTQQLTKDGGGFQTEGKPSDMGDVVVGDWLDFGYAGGQHGCGVIRVKDSGEKPTLCGAKNVSTWMLAFRNVDIYPPFVISVDGLLSNEAETMLKRLESCLATKWRQTYPRT